ncbi:MAG: hypothetical protein HY796_03305 [Elusimicrobia bacterium]|nr:hypothetical protein [Elusimicrobiota bacterium]
MDVLTRIKRLAIAHRIRFTLKADHERIRDGLGVEDIIESIVNAPAITKVIRSMSPVRRGRKERLYIIVSPTYDGTLVYTKGTFRKFKGIEEFYIFISAKRSIL